MKFFPAIFRKHPSIVDEKTSTNTTKIASLESVRGIAAFSVVIYHFFSIFFPVMLGAGFEYTQTRHDILFYITPLASLFSGSLAVSLFFILSGFVLTLRFFENKQPSLFASAFKRYFRLMPIALATILLSYSFMALGFYDYALGGVTTHSPWTGSAYFAFTPSFMGAIWQGLGGAFNLQAAGSFSYNPVLWTIYYELLGSFLVFGLASLCRGFRKRWILYGIFIIGFIHTYFVGFILGMLLSDLFVSFPRLFKNISSLPWVYKASAFALAFGVGSYPSIVGLPGSHLGKYWSMLTLSSGDISLSRTIMQLFAGAIIIVLALSWTGLRNLLENRAAQWLGKISYAVYALHFILLYSLTIALFVVLKNHLSYTLAAFAALALTLPVILALSHLVHLYIERPSIQLANRIGNWSKN